MMAPSDSAGRILVVDDSPTNRMLAAKMLSVAGYQVDTAADGREAVAFALAFSPDLILMDIGMPELDGLTATRRLRALRGPTADIPVIAMTANVEAADRAACFAAGMDDFIAKPFTKPDLLAVVVRWAGRRSTGTAPQPSLADAVPG